MISTLLLITVLLGNWLTLVPQKCSLIFAGDAMQHQAQIESARQQDGSFRYDNCFYGVKKEISQADLAIGNLEVTLGGEPYSGYPAFSAPDQYAQALANCGFDVLMTCNNHCMDRGSAGLVRTLDVLDSLGIQHLGTYRNQQERDAQYPLLVTAGKVRIALLAYTYGTNGISLPKTAVVNTIDTAQIAIDLHKAHSMKPDCIIVCMHWGEEYHTTQNRSQEELARWLIDNGADHIVGTHPHVVQPTAILPGNGMEKHLVTYSLGNFISNMSAPNTDRAQLLQMNLTSYGRICWLDSWRLLPIRTLRPAHGAGTRTTHFQVILDPQ